MLKSFMIRVKNKLLRQQVIAPMLLGTNNNIKFLVISGILEFGIVEIFTKEGYWMSFLNKSNAYSNVKSVTTNLEHLVEI